MHGKNNLCNQHLNLPTGLVNRCASHEAVGVVNNLHSRLEQLATALSGRCTIYAHSMILVVLHMAFQMSCKLYCRQHRMHPDTRVSTLASTPYAAFTSPVSTGQAEKHHCSHKTCQNRRCMVLGFCLVVGTDYIQCLPVLPILASQFTAP